MRASHKIIVGNFMSMEELPDGSVHLMGTFPPYFTHPSTMKGCTQATTAF